MVYVYFAWMMCVCHISTLTNINMFVYFNYNILVYIFNGTHNVIALIYQILNIFQINWENRIFYNYITTLLELLYYIHIVYAHIHIINDQLNGVYVY